MKAERSKVDFPLWRKKVDSSLFESAGTTIPKWVCELWKINEKFQHVHSKKDKASEVTIRFQGSDYGGNVAFRKHGSGKLAAALWFDAELCNEIRQTKQKGVRSCFLLFLQ